MLPDTPSATFPYRILARVGAGAMGEVYEAEDIELGRKVAIKVIKASFVESLPERDAEDALRRFVQEARAAAAFSHPGVTVVHRVGTEGGWPYIAMEWLDGRALEAVLAEHQRLSVEQTARVGLEVLSVLEAAHRTGITHRDVKPANLMVTRDRRIKVTDFGIARVQGRTSHTRVGQVLGTPQYAAPEQLAGRPIDVRADLYSVGAVLYECVVGRPPFEAESLYELMSKVQAERPLPASRQVAGVSAESTLSSRRLSQRIPTLDFRAPGEMARALQPFLATRPAASVAGPQAPVSGSGATLLRAPTLHVDGTSPHAIVGEVARGVAIASARSAGCSAAIGTALRPAPACSGLLRGRRAVRAVALICDGVLFQAFDVASGLRGTRSSRSCRALRMSPSSAVHRTLSHVPWPSSPLLAPSAPRLSGLDAAIVDVRQLATRLEGEGFDGTVRLRRNDQVAFLLFSKGKRILEVFGSGWPRAADGTRWEDWVAATGATVSVEDRRNAFPAITYRQQLREFALEVVRATEASPNAARSDSRAQAQMLQLLAATSVTSELPAESVVRSLLDADPRLASRAGSLSTSRTSSSSFVG
ncbi:MAG: serine/threonine protein kinase [Myxococcales bacterium]|nr:MAG: serine/threonine protein kinase [Myxococcales bacterium]